MHHEDNICSLYAHFHCLQLNYDLKLYFHPAYVIPLLQQLW